MTAWTAAPQRMYRLPYTLDYVLEFSSCRDSLHSALPTHTHTLDVDGQTCGRCVGRYGVAARRRKLTERDRGTGTGGVGDMTVWTGHALNS